jgi:hypothetical protein
VSGAFVDLTMTDTLLHQVFLHRGRLLNPNRPWVDRATTNILLQYAWAHYSVAEALSIKGQSAELDHHLREAQWWQTIASD